jgi:hypothetical protein
VNSWPCVHGRALSMGKPSRAHVVAILACDDAKSVVLDLVQPQVAGGQLVGLSGKARREESGREGTLQHCHGDGDGKPSCLGERR